jgi:hypothetical protein
MEVGKPGGSGGGDAREQQSGGVHSRGRLHQGGRRAMLAA